MNTQNRPIRNETRDSARKAGLTALLAVALGTHTGTAPASDEAHGSYDESILFSPSEAVLLAERKGRVTIYDGLEHRVVDRALDTQFGRIESMMFVRTRQALPDDSVEVDDDCD